MSLERKSAFMQIAALVEVGSKQTCGGQGVEATLTQKMTRARQSRHLIRLQYSAPWSTSKAGSGCAHLRVAGRDWGKPRLMSPHSSCLPKSNLG